MAIVDGRFFALAGLSILFFLINFTRNSKRDRLNYLIPLKRLSPKGIIKARAVDDFMNSLLHDPDKTIRVGFDESGSKAKRKFDIHSHRLMKFRRSSLNGEMFYMGPKGGVYKYTPGGNKKYV